jgi:transposase
VLNEFIHEMDLTGLEQSYNNQHGGRAAYHPVMLLSLLIYGYMNGIFSSRKIAKRLKQDLAFMYLAGNSTPDFRTLARFRKEKGACLEDIFATVVKKSHALGFVAFGTCSLDGTKIYANASKERNYNKEAMEERIRRLVQEAEAVDAREDAIYGDEEDDEDPLRSKPKKAESRRKKTFWSSKKKKKQHCTGSSRRHLTLRRARSIPQTLTRGS